MDPLAVQCRTLIWADNVPVYDVKNSKIGLKNDDEWNISPDI